MKKKYAFVVTLAMGLFIAQKAISFSGGAPSGSSNSPTSNNTSCDRAGCHNGPNAAGQTVTISTDIPTDGFLEDSVYTITITAATNGASGSNRIGFAASVESPSGHEGRIVVTNSGLTQKVGSQITHTSSGNTGSGGTITWNFDWDAETAPDQSTLYAAVNFTNQNGSTSGDVIVNQTLAFDKNLSIGQEELQVKQLSAYPNPANDQLTLASSEVLEGPFTLWSADGKQFKVEASPLDTQHWTLDLSSIPAGFYIVKDQVGHQVSISKL